MEEPTNNQKMKYSRNQRGSQSLSDLNHPHYYRGRGCYGGQQRGFRGRGRGQWSRQGEGKIQNSEYVKSSPPPSAPPVRFPPSYEESVGASTPHFYQPDLRSNLESQALITEFLPQYGGLPGNSTPSYPFVKGLPPPSDPLRNAAFLPKPPPRKSKVTDGQEFVSPDQIVKELVNFSDFFTDVETLSRILATDSKEILKVLQANSSVFQTMEDKATNKLLVELCPCVRICEGHLGQSGCSRHSCVNFHICLDYATDDCHKKNCAFGHSWKSNHNDFVLRNLALDQLPQHILSRLMQKTFKGTVGPKVCFKYQQQKCQLGDRCNELHICFLYVEGLGICPNKDRCNLNHNIRVPQCKALLEKLGVSLNESPREILKTIASRPDAFKDTESIDISDRIVIESTQTLQTGVASRSKIQQTSKITKDCDMFKSQKDKGTRTKDKREESETDKNAQKETVCAWNFHGNVEVPLICFMGLFGKCAYLNKGCKFLHAKKTYHWQFGANKRWYNFHPYHIGILESKFRDVNCDQIVLPKLNPEQVSKEMKDLFSLLGSTEVKVDFRNWLMTCQNAKKTYSIRHLATASTVIVDKPLNTIYNWYFKNSQGKWELYRNDQNLLHFIEKAYLEYSENVSINKATLEFAANSFKYKIDFSKMLQTNLGTGKVREVRRRPAPSPGEGGSVVMSNLEIPKHWEKMDKNEAYKLVMLNPTSREYKDVRQNIQLTHPLCNILSVLRVQNFYVWRHFKNKESELKKKYNQSDLNVQKLYIGINSLFLNDICRENFDWREHDPYGISRYGKGTCFYVSVAEALQKCSVDSNGRKKLLLVDVIIGEVTEGFLEMTRPPENPVFNSLFDTTVDSVTNPTVFVKYNKAEYYPSHVVEFA